MSLPPTPAEYSCALAGEIRRRREALGLSQNKLAKGAGISRTMLTHVERGMRLPTVETLVRLASGLGTTPAVILCSVERQPLFRAPKTRGKTTQDG